MTKDWITYLADRRERAERHARLARTLPRRWCRGHNLHVWPDHWSCACGAGGWGWLVVPHLEGRPTWTSTPS